jgi:hypothetical protein
MTTLRRRSLECIETQWLVSFDPAALGEDSRPIVTPPLSPGFFRSTVRIKEVEPGILLVTAIDIQLHHDLLPF